MQHRIAAAVRMRLALLQPYITSWSQALSLQASSERAIALWCLALSLQFS